MIVEFAGPGSGTAPLTWGQDAIWRAILNTAPDDRYFNFGRVLRVPGVRSVAEVATALSAVVGRHGSLRTRLELRGQVAGQRLEDRGTLPVEVVEGDPERVLDDLAATRFDYVGEWPVRVAFVVEARRVTHVVLVFCHLATDGLGAEIVLRDLRISLLRGHPPQGPAAPLPLDLARWQAGEEGRAVAAAAASHWERAHERIPDTMFARLVPDLADDPSDPPIWRALLSSKAVDLAVGSIAASHHTTTSTVLLAATAALVGRFTGHTTCAVLPIVSNRFRRDTTRLVSTLSQEGLFTLDVDGPFAETLRASGPAALRAYRSAYHDPADRERLVETASSARGASVHPRCCFNDMRFADPGPAPSAPAEIDRAREETELTWPMSQEKLNCRFCVHVSAEGVSLTADTRYLSRADMEKYLLDLESLLVETANA